MHGAPLGGHGEVPAIEPELEGAPPTDATRPQPQTLAPDTAPVPAGATPGLAPGAPELARDTGEPPDPAAPPAGSDRATDRAVPVAPEPPAPEVQPRVSRAAQESGQGARVQVALPEAPAGLAPDAPVAPAEPAPAAPLADASAAAAANGAGVPAEGDGEGDLAQLARDLPRTAEPERPAAGSDRAFEAALRTERRPGSTAPAAEPRAAAERPLPPDRAADVLRQVRVHLTPGLRQATVRLQPAHLGRVAIRIALREGRATTEIRAERASTLEALERHVPELRAALAQQGIDAGEFDLGLSSDHGPAFEDPPGARATRTAHLSLPHGAPEERAPHARPSFVGESAVDTYA